MNVEKAKMIKLALIIAASYFFLDGSRRFLISLDSRFLLGTPEFRGNYDLGGELVGLLKLFLAGVLIFILERKTVLIRYLAIFVAGLLTISVIANSRVLPYTTNSALYGRQTDNITNVIIAEALLVSVIIVVVQRRRVLRLVFSAARSIKYELDAAKNDGKKR